MTHSNHQKSQEQNWNTENTLYRTVFKITSPFLVKLELDYNLCNKITSNVFAMK